jgi:hypothetical protein
MKFQQFLQKNTKEYPNLVATYVVYFMKITINHLKI